MVKKIVFGEPIDTQAVVKKVELGSQNDIPGKIELKNGFNYRYSMEKQTCVYGLGEANRGINKRGYLYISDCADDPDHAENKVSLYGAHNFILVDNGKENRFGLFFDYPAKVVFDIGYTSTSTLQVSCERADLTVYLIKAEGLSEIVKEFRKIIGRSYIPPKFAFGYGQSRWGYKTREDFEYVVKQHRENHIPLDCLYMDIDYMDGYKDFTVNENEFPDFKAFVDEMKEQKIHLVPIIDAGVKVEDGYEVYEEGKKEGYFCKMEDGSYFTATVWPGYTHFPDVLNDRAREWFGNQYKVLLDAGIDGFWNDMNEPAIFHSPQGLAEAKEVLAKFVKEDTKGTPVWEQKGALERLANDPKDYERFYHEYQGKCLRHDQVHNLFGYNMTRAAAEAFERICPEKRILMFSRSSYVGMHRYGGVWQGDNKSWWSHILLNLKMMASLNMCGFLYTGADLGGFGCDTTEDLLLRWLALGVFTPLMRNHAALGTREQEAYQFEDQSAFKNVISVRYKLLPYIYSEYMKAALLDECYCRPLAFVYEEDEIAKHIEDQLIIGDEIMIAPVYTQNANGRFVYLPENMMFVKFEADGTISTEKMEKGVHFIEVELGSVPLFIREGKCIPIVDACENVEEIDNTTMKLLGYENSMYVLYEDDGVSTEYNYEEHTRVLK